MDIDKLLKASTALVRNVGEQDESASTRMVGAAAEKVANLAQETAESFIDTTLTPELERSVRQETSRMVSMANKRLRRLEEAGLHKTPAYRNWMEWEQGQDFGIRGKDYEGVVDEYDRLKRFIEHDTSSVRGATRHLKELGERIGLKHTDRVDIQEYAGKVFEISSKIQQYMRSTGEGTVIGTDEIFNYVSEYTQRDDLGVNALEDLDVDTLVDMLSYEDIQGDLRRKRDEHVRKDIDPEELDKPWAKLM